MLHPDGWSDLRQSKSNDSGVDGTGTGTGGGASSTTIRASNGAGNVVNRNRNGTKGKAVSRANGTSFPPQQQQKPKPSSSPSALSHQYHRHQQQLPLSRLPNHHKSMYSESEIKNISETVQLLAAQIKQQCASQNDNNNNNNNNNTSNNDTPQHHDDELIDGIVSSRANHHLTDRRRFQNDRLSIIPEESTMHLNSNKNNNYNSSNNNNRKKNYNKNNNNITPQVQSQVGHNTGSHDSMDEDDGDETAHLERPTAAATATVAATTTITTGTATTSSDDPSWVRAIRRGSRRALLERNEKEDNSDNSKNNDARINTEVEFPRGSESRRFHLARSFMRKKGRKEEQPQHHSAPVVLHSSLPDTRNDAINSTSPPHAHSTSAVEPNDAILCAALAEVVTEEWKNRNRTTAATTADHISDLLMNGLLELPDDHTCEKTSNARKIASTVTVTTAAKTKKTTNQTRMHTIWTKYSPYHRKIRHRVQKYTGIAAASIYDSKSNSLLRKSMNADHQRSVAVAERGSDAWMCGVCGKAFTSYVAATRHENRHIVQIVTNLPWISNTMSSRSMDVSSSPIAPHQVLPVLQQPQKNRLPSILLPSSSITGTSKDRQSVMDVTKQPSIGTIEHVWNKASNTFSHEKIDLYAHNGFSRGAQEAVPMINESELPDGALVPKLRPKLSSPLKMQKSHSETRNTLADGNGIDKDDDPFFLFESPVEASDVDQPKRVTTLAPQQEPNGISWKEQAVSDREDGLLLTSSMRQFLVLADEALLDACRKAEPLILSPIEKKAERSLLLLAQDKAYYDDVMVRKLLRQQDPSNRYRSDGESILGKLQNKFVDAYQLMKEKNDDKIDHYRHLGSGHDNGANIIVHTDETMYVNVIVKNSIQVVTRELQRLARTRWEMTEDLTNVTRFERLRVYTHMNIVKLAGIALASDFTVCCIFNAVQGKRIESRIMYLLLELCIAYFCWLLQS
jgi:hypothetical protein